MTMRHETPLEIELRQALAPQGGPGPALRERIHAAAADPPRRRFARPAVAAAVAAVFLLAATVAYALFNDTDSDRVFAARPNANTCATEDTVYFMCEEINEGEMLHSIIRYLDKATGIIAPLCGKPECTHTGSDCNAYAQGSVCGMAAYDGRLYWVAVDGTGRYQVYSAALDGTDRRMVRELDGDLVPDAMSDWSFQFHRGRVYLSCCKDTIVDGEPKESNYIVAYPLDPDEEGFVILDEETSVSRMRTQLYENSMYIVDTYSTDSGQRSAPRFRRWDVTTGEVEVLFDGQPPFEGGISDCWVTPDSIYTIESHSTGGGQYERSVYRYDLAGGTFERAFEWFTGGIVNVSVSDDLCVAVDCETYGQLTVLVSDFQGNTLLDAVLPTADWPRAVHVLAFAGADEKDMYFYNPERHFFAAVAMDGSGAKILWRQ